MKSLACFLILIVGSLPVWAQLSVDQFLREAVIDSSANAHATPPGGMRGLNRWINDAQLRAADDPDQHAFALRISPKFPRQIAAEDAVLDLRQRQLDLQSQTALNNRLKSRYLQWLDLLEQQNRVEAFDQARALADIEVQYQRSLAQTKDFRPSGLLAAELNLSRLIEQDRVQRDRFASLQTAIGIEPRADDVIAIEQMLRIITTTPVNETMVGEREEALVLELAKQQARIDKARQGWAIDLLQVERTTDRRTRTDSVGFLVGVRLPLGGRSFDSARREYDVASAAEELRNRTQVDRLEAANKRAQLQWRQSEVNAIGGTLATIDLRLQRARQQGDEAIVLAALDEQLKTRERLTELRQRACRDYLDYLHLNGQLAQLPLRNWLTTGQPPL